MYIKFKKFDEWLSKDIDLKDKFKEMYDFIYCSASEYAKKMNSEAKKKVNQEAKIEISEQLLKQSLIDAFDDLLRLKNYHLTKDPNPIKEIAYIVYWFLRRKPIRLINENLVLCTGLSDIARMRFLFINEEFCVKLLMNSAFKGKRERDICLHIQDEAKEQIKYYKQFLLYYLVYRLDSAKSLEGMMLGCTIHPFWEVDPVIWSKAKEDIEELKST